MNLKTYAMTGPVRKRFTKARVGDGFSRGGVDISRDDLRCHRVAGGLLGLKHIIFWNIDDESLADPTFSVRCTALPSLLA